MRPPLLSAGRRDACEMLESESLRLTDEARMHKNEPQRSLFQYIAFGILAGWAFLVLFRFYQEHTLGFTRSLRLIAEFQPPPLPASFLKVLTIVKHLFLAFILIFAGMLTGRRLLGLIWADRPLGGSEDKWSVGQNLMMALGLGWGLMMYLTFLYGRCFAT